MGTSVSSVSGAAVATTPCVKKDINQSSKQANKTDKPVNSPVSSKAAPEETKNDRLAQAIEKNNDTTRILSYVALGTSVATLLPLSVLAVKSHQMGKVVDDLGKKAEPILDNLKGSSDAVKSVADQFKGKAEELLNLANFDELRNLINTVVKKVKDADVQTVLNQINKSIESVEKNVNKKIDDNQLLEKTGTILDNIQKSVKDADIKQIINDIMKNIKGVLEEKKVFENVNNILTSLDKKVKDADVASVLEKVKSSIQSVEKNVNEKIDKSQVLDEAQKLLTDARDKVNNTDTQKLIDELKQQVETLANNAQQKLNAVDLNESFNQLTEKILSKVEDGTQSTVDKIINLVKYVVDKASGNIANA